MTFSEKRDVTRPKSGEAPFKIDETFYSRTDGRGIILSGNYVFQRVSDYPWEDLIGAPHKTIRHPEMPKGVFWLLWDTIKRSETMGAYVKNRARDGLYYWVYAVIVPCGDGYLSARIKPTSDMLAVVSDAYQKLQKAESEEGLEPEESAQRLIGTIKDLGFDDYREFAARALTQELLARDRGIGDPENPLFASFMKMADAAKALEAETAGLIEDFRISTTMPTNMRIIASRLEPMGGPLSTLSKNYGMMSNEMFEWFEANVNGPQSKFASIRPTIGEAMMLGGLVEILDNSREQLSLERRQLGPINIEEERAMLFEVSDVNTQKARDGLQQVTEESKRILSHCEVMRRHVVGLGTTRVMCEIEKSRISNRQDSLGDIINQMAVFQEKVSNRLKKIENLSGDILKLAEQKRDTDAELPLQAATA